MTSGERQADGNEPTDIKVWDPLVRVGHWLLVPGFIVAYVTEDDLLFVHNWAGYLVAGIVLVRVVWGFLAPGHARFSSFLTGPGAAIAYLKGLASGAPRRYIGHNPAGGLMILALLACLTATTLSGMAYLALERNEGPLAPLLGQPMDTALAPPLVESVNEKQLDAGDYDKDKDNDRGRDGGDSLLKELHEFFAHLTLVLVLLHVAGVVVSSRAHGENLVKAMFTGRKRR